MTILEKLRKILPGDQSQDANNKRNLVWEKWDTNLFGFLNIQDIQEGIRILLDVPNQDNILTIISIAYRQVRQMLNVQNRFGSNYLQKKQFRLFVENFTKLIQKKLIFQHFGLSKDNQVVNIDNPRVSKVFQRWNIDDQKVVELHQLSLNNNLNFDKFLDWIQSLVYYNANDLK